MPPAMSLHSLNKSSKSTLSSERKFCNIWLVHSPTSRQPKLAYRGALWILGEYSLDAADVQNSWKHIRASIGELPIVQTELRSNEGENAEQPANSSEVVAPSGPVVLPDGTYASESAFAGDNAKVLTKEEKDSKPPLRRFILNGDFYTTSVLATTIVKCVLRFEKTSEDKTVLNALSAEAMLILVSILRAGQSSLVEKKIDEDSSERIMIALSILMKESDAKESSDGRKLAFGDGILGCYKSLF